MPTERFYNLPEEKRHIIREAAVKEFARVPLEQVSINKIIQEAQISRGSFYTYFEDKRDVMIYLLEDIKESCKRACITSLNENGGDYFRMLEDGLEYLMNYFKNGNYISLYHNMMLNTEVIEHMAQIAKENINGEESNYFADFIYEKIKSGQRKYRDNIIERFKLISELAAPLMMKMAFECCYEKKDIEVIKAEFHNKMELLKCVIYCD